MRQPRNRLSVASSRALAGISTPVFAARAHCMWWTSAGMAFLAGSLLSALFALLIPEPRPASLRMAGSPTGLPFAATDAHLLHLSLLILTFIEGAFAWEIVINTGQSAEAAPRAPDMDRRQPHPPKATWESLGQRRRRLSSLRQRLALPLVLRRLPDRLLRVECGGGKQRRRRMLKGDGRAARPNAAMRMEPAARFAEGLSSATCQIPESVGSTGVAAVVFAAK